MTLPPYTVLPPYPGAVFEKVPIIVIKISLALELSTVLTRDIDSIEDVIPLGRVHPLHHLLYWPSNI